MGSAVQCWRLDVECWKFKRNQKCECGRSRAGCSPVKGQECLRTVITISTSNIQRPTPNAEVQAQMGSAVQCWRLDVGCWKFGPSRSKGQAFQENRRQAEIVGAVGAREFIEQTDFVTQHLGIDVTQRTRAVRTRE